MICRGNCYRRPGVVLVVVLWILVILTALCLSLNARVRTQAWRTTRGGSAHRNGQAVRSALVAAGAIIEADDPAVDTFADTWAGQSAGAFVHEINGAPVVLFTPAAAGQCPGLADEAARLNANTASAEMLAGLDGIDSSVAEAFVAARAELEARIADTAADLAGPARGLTGPIGTLDQLAALLAKAMGQAGAEEAAASSPVWENPRRLPASVAEVMRHLTLHTRQANRSADGRERVNINTADEQTLVDRLGDTLNAVHVKAIILARQDAPFDSVGELLTRSLVTTSAEGKTTPVPLAADQLARIVDRITTTEEPVLTGLVNVNTADAEVLRCLPGLDGSVAEAIVQERHTLSTGQASSIGWLLNVLDAQQFRQVAPFVTTRTTQFRLWAACGESWGAGATYVEAIIERNGRANGVLHLAFFRGLWDDSLSAF